jgi:DUF2993 family protein
VKWAAAFVVLVLAASQLALPSLAENRLESELASTGTVSSVEVHAFPALKLLFQRADSVRVRMSSASVGVGDLGDRLDSTRRTGSLDVAIDTLAVGPLQVRDVALHKDGDELEGSASLTRDDLQAALPLDLGLRPVESSDGAIVLEAEVGPVAVRGRLSDSDGALLIAPDGLLGGFASVTVFEDPRVRITGVSAEPRPDGFTVVIDGELS